MEAMWPPTSGLIPLAQGGMSLSSLQVCRTGGLKHLVALSEGSQNLSLILSTSILAPPRRPGVFDGPEAHMEQGLL